jgi:hypothetical protein
LEDYLFHEGRMPSGYSQDFESSLFNQPTHLLLQAPDGWKAFYILNEKYRTASASVWFNINQGVAHSPVKSPYGSVEFNEDLPPIVLFRFLEFVESRLKARGIEKIIIKDCPSNYRADEAALLQTFLFNLGYQVINAEAGTLIPITTPGLGEALHAWEVRKLRQATDARLIFRELSLDQLGEVYLFILSCRKVKGYSLSMSLTELKQAVNAFERRFHFFGVYDDERLAAASIGIRVRENVLYNFYSAHASAFDAVSPVVFLISRMYGFCFEQKIKLLDLGTSALDGKPNFTLLDFKMRLGGKPTTKLTFQKNLLA